MYVGHLAKVDSMDELTALSELFEHDNDLSIGLRDIGGSSWRWVSHCHVMSFHHRREEKLTGRRLENEL